MNKIFEITVTVKKSEYHFGPHTYPPHQLQAICGNPNTIDGVWERQKCWFKEGDIVKIKDIETGEEKTFVKE